MVVEGVYAKLGIPPIVQKLRGLGSWKLWRNKGRTIPNFYLHHESEQLHTHASIVGNALGN